MSNGAITERRTLSPGELRERRDAAFARERASRGTIGSGAPGDPVRRATPAEAAAAQRQQALTQLQRDLSATGTTLSSAEAQAIIEGRATVDQIRQQVVDRTRREALTQLQRDLSATGARLSEAEARSILEGTEDFGALSQRVVSAAEQQRRERVQARISGIDLSDPRVVGLIEQGFSPEQVRDLQARETLLDAFGTPTREDLVGSGGLLEAVPERTDLFFGERVEAAAQRGLRDLSTQEGFGVGVQNFLFGAQEGFGRASTLVEGAARIAPFASPFSAPGAFVSRALFGVDPRTERALRGTGAALAALPGLVVQRPSDVLFGLAEPGAGFVQQARTGQLTERELGLLGFEAALSAPLLQPARTGARVTRAATAARARVLSALPDELVRSRPPLSVSVRAEGLVGGLPAGIDRATQARLERLRPRIRVFDDVPTEVGVIGSSRDRVQLTLQEIAEIEAAIAASDRAAQFQTLQGFPPPAAQQALVTESGQVVAILPRDIPLRRTMQDPLTLLAQQRADELAAQIGRRRDLDRLLSAADTPSQTQLATLEAIRRSDDFLPLEPFVVRDSFQRELLDFFPDLRPPTPRRIRGQPVDTISVSQLGLEDIGFGVPRFSLRSRRPSGFSAQQILDNPNVLAEPFGLPIFFDPTGVSQLVRRSPVSRVPRTITPSTIVRGVSPTTRGLVPNIRFSDLLGRSAFVARGVGSALFSDSGLASATSVSSLEAQQPFFSVASVLDADSVFDLDTGLRTGTTPSLVTGLGLVSEPVFDTRSRLETVPRTRTSTSSVLQALTLQDAIPRTRTRTTTLPRTRTTPTGRLRPRRTPPIRLPLPTPEVGGISSLPEGEAQYEVTVGKPGNVVYEELGVGGRELILAGKQQVRNTAAASLTVRPLTQAAASKNILQKIGRTNFKKGRAANTFIERRNKRIDSPGELQQITAEGIRANTGRRTGFGSNPRVSREANRLVDMGVPLREVRNSLGGGVLDDFF